MKILAFLKKIVLRAIIVAPKIAIADKPPKKRVDENEKPILLEDLPIGTDGQILVLGDKLGKFKWADPLEAADGYIGYSFENSGIEFNSMETLTLKDVGEPAPKFYRPLNSRVASIANSIIQLHCSTQGFVNSINHLNNIFASLNMQVLKTKPLQSTDVLGWQKLRNFLNKNKPNPLYSKGGLI